MMSMALHDWHGAVATLPQTTRVLQETRPHTWPSSSYLLPNIHWVQVPVPVPPAPAILGAAGAPLALTAGVPVLALMLGVVLDALAGVVGFAGGLVSQDVHLDTKEPSPLGLPKSQNATSIRE